MREYELWLDESGDFEQESQTTGHPSLVGGILIEKGQLSEDEITELVNAEANHGVAHAKTMDRTGVQRIVLPALETICLRHGKLVYFENREELDTLSNRGLYLRVLAAGLVQLMQYLGKDGSFGMDVTIALRYAPEGGCPRNCREIACAEGAEQIVIDKAEERSRSRAASSDDNAVYGNLGKHNAQVIERQFLSKIQEEEYVATLRQYIQEQWRNGTFDIDPRTRLNLAVMSAREERRLQLADYACNARFTRHKPQKFTSEMRARLDSLFDGNYIYSVHVKTTENTILSFLAAGDVAGALVELYTSREPGSLREMRRATFARLEAMGYRLARLQVNLFASRIVGMARQETDFERGEDLLRGVIQDFFPKLQSRGIDVQTDEAMFRLKWCLSDMYLRQGDIVRAAVALSEMRDLLRTMNYRVENLRFLYLYLDRRALFEIDCMAYGQAAKTMDQAIRCMEEVRSVLECSGTIQEFFGKGRMASEWLGNAYCMKIYAEMFLQRARPELYPAIREDTEAALAQYEYPGELERTLQYRAHIEMEAGHCREALEWLFRTQQLDPNDDLTENCVSYLDDAVREDHLSRCYYLMYYVEIMEAAQRTGDSALADAMQQGLEIQREMLEEFLQEDALETDLRSDTEKEPRIFRNFLWDSLKWKPVPYHPLEIVKWKYGSYLAASGCRARAAIYWKEAIRISNQNPDDAVMRIVRLAILMEQLGARIRWDGETDKKAWRQADNFAARLAKDEGMSSCMQEYALSCRKTLAKAADPSLPPEERAGLCYRESRKIAF